MSLWERPAVCQNLALNLHVPRPNSGDLPWDNQKWLTIFLTYSEGSLFPWKEVCICHWGRILCPSLGDVDWNWKGAIGCRWAWGWVKGRGTASEDVSSAYVVDMDCPVTCPLPNSIPVPFWGFCSPLIRLGSGNGWSDTYPPTLKAKGSS